MTRTIPGRTGNQAQGPSTDVKPPEAGEPPERSGQLARDDHGLYVQSGSLKIRIDPASARGLMPPRTSRPSIVSFNVPPEFEKAIAAAKSAQAQALLKQGEVVAVRAGFKFVSGCITKEPAVVIAVSDLSVRGLPTSIDGVPTDVTMADPLEQLQESEAFPIEAVPTRALTLIDALQSDAAAEAEEEEAGKVITYVPPANADLEPVTASMTVTCSVSPDNGWAVLRPFLLETRRKMRLGMYDFTAPHIYKTVRTVLKDTDVSWRQTLGPGESLPKEGDVDSTKALDFTEEKVNRGLKRAAGPRFQNAFARTGAGETFASAYHIKVAVRDDASFWLSSGNWQSSNQPDIDFSDVDADRGEIARYNREWHLVVECRELAAKFQKYLEHDFRTAGFEEAVAEAASQMPDLLVPIEEFYASEEAAQELEYFPPLKRTYPDTRPLRIQPILTPDNYIPVVLELLRKRPRDRLYFQNQSLSPIKKPTAEYAELLSLLAKYSQDEELDVRIIFRNIGPVRKKLESLQLAGFNMDRVKLQAGCHTKGIVIDGETLLVGSHNWTNEGTQLNRDASLLLKDKALARYYERVFLHDWEKLSKPSVRPESMPIVVHGSESVSLEESGRYVRVPWTYFEED